MFFQALEAEEVLQTVRKLLKLFFRYFALTNLTQTFSGSVKIFEPCFARKSIIKLFGFSHI